MAIKIATEFECPQFAFCGWKGSNPKIDCWGIAVCPDCNNDDLTPLNGIHPNKIDPELDKEK